MRLSEKQMKSMRADFRNFCHVLWQELGLPPLTPVQNDIAYYLQHGPKRMQVSAFRGVGKSYLTAAFVVWCLWKNKELKIMIVSAGKDRADAFAIFVKNIIRDTSWLCHMMPDSKLGERDTQNIFDIRGCKSSGSPSVKSVGITGQITGSRADIIIADDIEIPSNSATHDQREKLATRVTEFDAILTPIGRTIYLGTPQTELSLYNTLYNRGYDMKIWPVRKPSVKQMEAYGAKLADFIRSLDIPEGTSVSPRFSEEDLAERELSYGRSGFALQFMLDTSLSDADKFPLKINDLIVSEINRDLLPDGIYWSNNPLLKMKDLVNVAMGGQNYYAPERLSEARGAPDMSVLAIDPSGRGKDETGYAVGLMRHGNIFVPEAGGVLGGYTDDALKQLAYIAKEHRVQKIIIESNFGDGMFTQLFKPHLQRIYPVECEEVRHNQQKELRIVSTLEPVLNQHRLIVDPKVIESDYATAMEHYPADKAPAYMLFYQLSRLSKERGSLKHDDRLDALAIMVKYFLDALDIDQETQQKRKKEEALDNMLDNFVREWYEDNTSSTRNQPIRLWR